MVYIFEDFSAVNPDDIDYLCQQVSIERCEKAKRYKRTIDQIMSLTAYALLTYGLYLEHGIVLSPHDTFVKNAHGKPCLKEHPHVNFNMSHCEKGVVCAIQKNTAVGIDIQNTVSYDEGLIDYVCSKGEKKRVTSAANPELYFTRLWSLKESYVKYHGTGINRQIFDLDFSKYEANYFDLYSCKFSIFPKNDYTISVCSDSYVSCNELRHIDLLKIKDFYNVVNIKRQNCKN
ncbi:4'-phosphopantetheinyl transferase superfamily protein [Vallitalea pronyensis]|uniref:4'-phosphopantetheinyl transferase superfamily protein n=1 Tax=Vallitalea pronyensis TaxID=1348613 RepID=A0A8J8MLR1_9FIRM|nr:4'-phosphopantetheinyl transferase superfamily protein [Vallitalea pronyensis]QUI23826.1 4'-phosphopantetheinyl transferase superfamily protein [Vallitalea pronyensis]